jgi:adenylate cyclase
MRGDPEQRSCSDGMPEELITERSRLAGFSIIARNSGFSDKGKPVKPGQVNRVLRVRVTPEEAEHRGGPSMNAGAEENLKQGMQLYRRYTQEENARARGHFEEARKEAEEEAKKEAKTDSQLPSKHSRLAANAYAGLAATYRQDWNFGWTTNDPAELRAIEQRAFDAARESVKLDGSLPDGHVQLAYLHLYKMDHDQAEKEAREAVRLGGDRFADGYAVLAQVLTHAGEPQIAVALMEKAMALENEPQKEVPVYYLRHLGQAYYVMGQVERYQKGDDRKATEYYQKAEEHLKRAMEVNSKHRQARLTLAAVYMESGKEPQAKELFRSYQDMSQHVTIGKRRQQAPYKDQMLKGLYISALRRAWSSSVGRSQ